MPGMNPLRRLRTRMSASGRLSAAQASAFGVARAAASTGVLLVGANPLAAALALGNVLLYAGVYTPLKRVTVFNTHVGAVVGAVPPLVGWAAATGSLAAVEPLLLGYALFAWQFPHFYALAWTLRKDYARGGHVMVPRVQFLSPREARLSRSRRGVERERADDGLVAGHGAEAHAHVALEKPAEPNAAAVRSGQDYSYAEAFTPVFTQPDRPQTYHESTPEA